MYYHQILVARELGGAGVIATRLADDLRQQGRHSMVWYPGPGPACEEALRRGLATQEYDIEHAFSRNPLGAAYANWKFGRRLGRFAPGVAHLHAPVYYGALHRGLRQSGVRPIVHVHIEGDIEGLRWAFRSPPDVIVTCAKFLVDFVRGALPKRLRDHQPITSIPNAVDTERFCPGDKATARAQVGAPAMPLALMLANLSPHKGQETAIRAIARLKSRGIDVAGWLAGVEREDGGTYTTRLQTLIHECGVADRVRLLGHRRDAPTLLRAADCLLLPSTCEGLPLSLLEAQATGVPVLAAPTAGVPEIIADEETGLLRQACDVVGYAAGIARVIADVGLRERLVRTAREHVLREHTWKAYSQRVFDLYTDVMERSWPLHAAPTSHRGNGVSHSRQPLEVIA